MELDDDDFYADEQRPARTGDAEHSKSGEAPSNSDDESATADQEMDEDDDEDDSVGLALSADMPPLTRTLTLSPSAKMHRGSFLGCGGQ